MVEIEMSDDDLENPGSAFINLADQVEMALDDVMMSVDSVRPSELGLDDRAGHGLFPTKHGIVVALHNDKGLRYYGGFEYIDDEYRVQLGNYVMYLAEADRVKRCLDRFFGKEEEENDNEDV